MNAYSSDVAEFSYALFIGRPAATVWEALISKPIVDQYYMVPLVCLELNPGGKISYGNTGGELIVGQVREATPSLKLVHTFHFVGSEDTESLVIYEIEQCGEEMCSLRLTHTGFASENQTYADISGGWPVVLSSLKTLLETGKLLPWPGR